jgi:hypothetical protein
VCDGGGDDAVLQLTLTREEGASLRDVLTGCLGDLRMEIAGTESYRFREHLKEQEVFLKRIIDQLGDAVPVS